MQALASVTRNPIKAFGHDRANGTSTMEPRKQHPAFALAESCKGDLSAGGGLGRRGVFTPGRLSP